MTKLSRVDAEVELAAEIEKVTGPKIDADDVLDAVTVWLREHGLVLTGTGLKRLRKTSRR